MTLLILGSEVPPFKGFVAFIMASLLYTTIYTKVDMHVIMGP